MNRRGQIAIFIVLAVISLISLYLILTSEKTAKRMATSPMAQAPVIEPEAVRQAIEGCYQDFARVGTTLFGMSGSYIDAPPDVETIPPLSIRLLYDRGTKQLNPKPEEGLAKFMDEMVLICVDLDYYEKRGATITARMPNTKVTFRENDVLFATELPLTFKIQNQQFTVKDIRTTVPVRMNYILSVAKTLIDNTHMDPDHFNITFMGSFDLNVSAGIIEPDKAVFRITDEKSNILPRTPYDFVFAVRI